MQRRSKTDISSTAEFLGLVVLLSAMDPVFLHEAALVTFLKCEAQNSVNTKYCAQHIHLKKYLEY